MAVCVWSNSFCQRLQQPWTRFTHASITLPTGLQTTTMMQVKHWSCPTATVSQRMENLCQVSEWIVFHGCPNSSLSLRFWHRLTHRKAICGCLEEDRMSGERGEGNLILRKKVGEHKQSSRYTSRVLGVRSASIYFTRFHNDCLDLRHFRWIGFLRSWARYWRKMITRPDRTTLDFSCQENTRTWNLGASTFTELYGTFCNVIQLFRQRSLNVISQIVELTFMRVLHRTSPVDKLDGPPMFKCGISYDVALALARDLDVALNELMWDLA